MSKVFTITEGLENLGALRTGGQGSVYKGRRMGAIISAVKLLPTPIFTEDKNDKNFKAFDNEVTKLKKVNEVPNPNIVKILNSGLTESGSFPFIEMEYIEGPDLEELLQLPHDKIFTIKETIKLADQLANALAHCHKVGVKHGDVKSNNVKYNPHTGNYVLLDFGLAIMSDEQRRTSMRHAGAIEFMAPEQNMGTMLFQTDIYSYGVILYELLAGRVPFPLQDKGETSRNTVMIAHMESPVPNLLDLRRINLPKAWSAQKQDLEMRVPKWLLGIIAKCLEKHPEKRYPDGVALQDAIIDGSVEAIKNEDRATANTKALINRETTNVHLKTRATISNDPNMTYISKPLLFGLVGLLICCIGFSGYMLYSTTHKATVHGFSVQDSLAKDSANRVNMAIEQREQQRQRDSIIHRSIWQDQQKQRREAAGENVADSTITDTTNKVTPPGND
jgi:serine/threonine protein kinase